MKTTLACLALLALLATQSSARAGALSGPQADVDVIAARNVAAYTVTFRAGQRAEVAVVGDGDTDLDLYVYDELGNLVGSDEDFTDQCFVAWYPKWTGRFTIRVVNRGHVANRAVIGTN